MGVVSSGSVPDFYDIYRYLNWVRVSGYHEVSISNIHKCFDISSIEPALLVGGQIFRKKRYVILDWPLR